MVLALHELCTNIIRHGCASAEGIIVIEGRREPQAITYVVRDTATHPFSPPPDISLPDPHSLPQGGWGMYILYRLMDQIEYRRVGSGSEWILKRYLDERRERT
jgi:anti-sigma regulatory factor (Ser/Thr protein kinase)